MSPGAISAASTDAVNGSQLFAIGSQLVAIDGRVTALEGKIGTPNPNGGDVKYFHTNSTLADSVASGTDSVAVGAGSVASGNNSATLGTNAQATGENAVAMGTGASATANNSTALGTGASATANNSTALGTGASARANNSTALGANSVADRENSVSVGAVGRERQITNVAAATQGTDAVNLDQLNKTVSNANQRFSELKHDLEEQDDTLSAGIAGAMAMASLPQPYSPSASMTSIGAASYRGQSALSFGASRISDNGRWVSKLQASTNTQGDVGVSVGVGYQW